MGAQIIVKEYLQQFRLDLLQDIRLLADLIGAMPVKDWMEGNEAGKLAGISANTLRNLRNHFSKPGNVV